MHLPEPTFPPLLTGHPVKGKPGPFEVACAKAAAGEAGAGDVFWARDTARLDWACVLEPEVKTARALQMHFTAMLAFADAFGAISPPEVALQFRWPRTLLVNGGVAGAARTASGPENDEGIAQWMTVGIALTIKRDTAGFEPGETPDETALHEEGCGEITRTQLVESLSRHFLNWVHTWNEEGFKAVHEGWLSKAESWQGLTAIDWEGEVHMGTFVTMDDEGNMLLQTETGMVSLPIAKAVEAWPA